MGSAPHVRFSILNCWSFLARSITYFDLFFFFFGKTNNTKQGYCAFKCWLTREWNKSNKEGVQTDFTLITNKLRPKRTYVPKLKREKHYLLYLEWKFSQPSHQVWSNVLQCLDQTVLPIQIYLNKRKKISDVFWRSSPEFVRSSCWHDVDRSGTQYHDLYCHLTKYIGIVQKLYWGYCVVKVQGSYLKNIRLPIVLTPGLYAG